MFKENTYWTNVLKKIVYILLIFVSMILFLKLAAFYMPFLIALIISLLIEPVIKKIMEKFKISRRFSSIIVFVVVLGTILGLLIWGIVTIVSEATNLLAGFNAYYEKISNQIQNIINSFNFEKIKISPQISQMFQDTLFSALQRLSIGLQSFLGNLIKFFTSIPSIAIYVAVTILSLYFICTDKIYMIDEIEHHLPEKWVKNISTHFRQIITSLGGYLKAQLTLVLISFGICLIGLYIMHFAGLDVGFPLLIAIGIGFVDALPILGSGAVMIPWAIISGLSGNLTLGISIVALLIIMSLTRQFIEPKIVSGNIGIHPIFTLIAMYTGFRLIGIIGIFIGPILLIIFKNVFSDFIDTGVVKAIFEDL